MFPVDCSGHERSLFPHSRATTDFLGAYCALPQPRAYPCTPFAYATDWVLIPSSFSHPLILLISYVHGRALPPPAQHGRTLVHLLHTHLFDLLPVTVYPVMALALPDHFDLIVQRIRLGFIAIG